MFDKAEKEAEARDNYQKAAKEAAKKAAARDNYRKAVKLVAQDTATIARAQNKEIATIKKALIDVANKISKIREISAITSLGEKITIAPTTDDDIPELKKFLGDNDTIKYLNANTETSRLSYKDKEKMFSKKRYSSRFTIKNSENKIVGNITASADVRVIKDGIQVEIGYFLGKEDPVSKEKYTGKHYISTAGKKLCDEIIKIPEIKKIIAFYHKNNTDSGFVAKSICKHLKENDNSLKVQEDEVVTDKDGNETNALYTCIKK